MDLEDSAALSGMINEQIDHALIKERMSEPPRKYMGGSQAGKPCSRALFYDYQSAQHKRPRNPDTITPEMTKKFPNGAQLPRRAAMGHAHEDITASWMQKAGYELVTLDLSGNQMGFETGRDPRTGEPRIAGHVDGIIEFGPIDLPYPLLWEHKIMRSDLWRKCKASGVAVSNPEYLVQLQIYMGYMDLHHALFTCLNTDTSELQFEFISFDREQAQRASDKLLDVVNGTDPDQFERIASHPGFWRCQWCKHKRKCWGDAA